MTEWTRERRYQRLEDTDPAVYAALAARVSRAPWRQRWHIQPPAGLLNDPNGFCWDGSRYHLFYQWFPLGAVHGLKYWRALESLDLVHFADCGIAIAPDSEYDSHGAYSGSALPNPDGSLTIAYTGNHRSAGWQRIPYQLTGRYDSRRFSRDAPFMAGPPAGFTEHVRDPKIWRDSRGRLCAVLGAQRSSGTGTALLTREGELLGELNTALADFGYMWECPDLFPLDRQSVFLFSPQGVPAQGYHCRNLYQTGVLIGAYDADSLTLTHGGFQELDAGFDFYAAQTCQGANGERMLIAWMGMPDTAYPTDSDGWQGCLTLPRLLSLEDGRLIQRPLPALAQLRGVRLERPTRLSSGELHYANPERTPFSLELCQGGGCAVRLDYDGGILTLDRSQSGCLPQLALDSPPQDKTNLSIRQLAVSVHALQIFLDASSIEIFINGGEHTMTARLFPPDGADGIACSGQGRLYGWAYA